MFPEFDEVNQAILEQLGEDGVDLVCETCGTVFVFDVKFAYEICNECKNGYMLPVDEDNDVITLPEGLKNGGAYEMGTSGLAKSDNSAWSGAGVTTWERHDHPGDKIIFESEGKKLYASNSSSLREWSGKWGLIIDLAGVVSIPNITPFVSNSAPAKYRELSKLTGKEKELPSQILRLNWNDMGAPPVGLNFWDKMWQLIPEKTVICCVGGHGRTGSFLTAMMIAKGHDYWEALEHVRKEHCHKAVESVAQEKYLHELYVERLLREINLTPDGPDLEGLKVALAYAKDNVPSYTLNTATKGWNKSSSTTETSKSKSLTPTTHKVDGVGQIIKFYEPEGNYEGIVSGSDLADALVSKRSVKTVQEGQGPIKVFVEECLDNTCSKIDCKDFQHLGWVEWERSLASIEVQYSQYQ